MDKRTFLKSTALLGMGATAGLSALGRPSVQNPELPVEGGAADEENFWKQVRGMYKVKPDYINLENGYYCIQPQEVLTKYFQHIMDVNLQGAYYMRTVQFENKQKAANKVAELLGCSPEECIVTRNTTESLLR